jgi:hypothetical protein
MPEKPNMNAIVSSFIRERIAAARLTYDDVFFDTSEVVIFGSRAVGLHRPTSDLDVLLITPRKRRIHASGLDFVIVSPKEIEGRFWLESELASHIARYGKWVEGTGDWCHRAHIGDRAIFRKRKRVESLTENAAERWSRLHPVFHTKYAITIRRELQRLDLLLNRVPIPATPILDSIWRSNTVPSAHLFEVASSTCKVPSLQAIAGLIKRIDQLATTPPDASQLTS